MQPLRTTKMMPKVIRSLADKFGIDLTQPGSSLRLEQPHFHPLVIVVIDRYQISVAHYYEMNGDLMRDPEMVFYTGIGLDEWVPGMFTQDNPPHYTEALEYRPDGGIKAFYPYRLAELLSFTTLWAKNLRDQDWINATPVRIQRVKPDLSPIFLQNGIGL